MKKLFTFVLLVLSFPHITFSQTSLDCAVRITASVQNSPPQIILSWPTNTSTTQYTILKKLKTATSWGTALATLNGSVTSYTDNAVTSGVSYEYKIQRTGSNYTGYGFINSGIEVPAIEDRGKLILMVDSAFTASLSTEISRLETDLEGDGWTVIRHDVLRTGSVTHVKSLIVTDYNNDPANTKALFILGHVPVPYSGNINPDGHPDHLGAWPTDTYYADVNGAWTDNAITSTTASPARTQNVPGDGKFDQSVIPSPLELQTGRVDLYNLTSFTLTETQLMKNYLDKDHEYRKKIYVPVKRGVVDDNFGYMSGEAFAASGYNAMASLVGTSSITAADYFTSMNGNSYQWSYGCGGGSFTSAGGIGNTTNFSTSNLQGVFTMLFGSYFGDWDVQNSFLRAPLAQGKILTNTWSGRPHWVFHHMALGENIGYSAITTQNYQQSLYFPNIYGIHGGWIHNGLMGDPTLRNDVVAPVSNVVATKGSGYDCNISWSATTETNIAGYNIYMKNPVNTNYVKINSTLIAGTTYTDNCLLYQGIYKYMVRAVKLEASPSGTYYNMSEGIADTAMNNNPPPPVTAQFTGFTNGSTVTCVNNSTNATTYSWDFGNGATSTATAPVYNYTVNGTYTITLIASNECLSDTSDFIVIINNIGVGLHEFAKESGFDLHPNPAHEHIVITGHGINHIWIYNSEGKEVYNQEGATKEINVAQLKRGLYLVKVTDNHNRLFCRRLVID